MTPEILAPAGSFEAAAAAVNSGADAIYLGQKRFSARANAQNFDEEQLAQTVRLCHNSGVKVYQAVNTIAFDREFSDLERCVATAAELGVDALIVQDLGVAAAVKRWVPELRLHASTQMSISSAGGAAFAKRMGFSRVVLARELSLEEIHQIAQSVEIELEAFVHGALCMCVSGQCYLSAMLGSRSANRGGCAQPCRLPFSADGTGSCDLSLKDLSAMAQLRQLEELGVASFKIEGRMKRPEYVGAAVSAVRETLSGGTPDMERLRSVFSRDGFTDGYLTARRGRSMFGVRTKADVTAAQGVLRQISSEYRQPFRRVPLDMKLELCAERPSKLEVADRDGHCVTAEGSVPEPALHLPMDRERAWSLLSKLGQTPYVLEKLELAGDQGLTLPASGVNSLRRQACDLLRAQREAPDAKSFSAEPLVFEQGEHRDVPLLRARFSSLQQVPWEWAEKLELFSLPVEEIFSHRERLAGFWEKVAAELPRVRFGCGKDEKLFEELKASGLQHLLVHTVSDIELGRRLGMQLHGGFSLNAANSASVAVLEEQGLCDLVISPELRLKDAARLKTRLPLGLVAYGSLPLMVFRNCPVRAQRGCRACGGNGSLTDRKGVVFPVVCRGETAELLNSRPVVLSDRQGDLRGMDFAVLYFTKESRGKCAEEFLRWEQKRPAGEEFTRGLYYRGVE